MQEVIAQQTWQMKRLGALVCKYEKLSKTVIGMLQGLSDGDAGVARERTLVTLAEEVGEGSDGEESVHRKLDATLTAVVALGTEQRAQLMADRLVRLFDQPRGTAMYLYTVVLRTLRQRADGPMAIEDEEGYTLHVSDTLQSPGMTVRIEWGVNRDDQEWTAREWIQITGEPNGNARMTHRSVGSIGGGGNIPSPLKHNYGEEYRNTGGSSPKKLRVMALTAAIPKSEEAATLLAQALTDKSQAVVDEVTRTTAKYTRTWRGAYTC
jgi:hypothetical protein